LISRFRIAQAMLSAFTESLASSDAPNRSTRPLEAAELRRLKKFGDSVNRLSANFAVLDAQGRLVLVCDGGAFESDQEQLAECGRMTLEKHGGQCSHGSQDKIVSFGQAKRYVTAVLNLHGAGTAVAIIDLPEPSATVERSDEHSVDASVRLDVDYFRQMLGILADGSDTENRAQDEIEEWMPTISRWPATA
jgi:hypothetical protein